MAKFQANKIDLQTINGGQRFVDGSPVSANAINAPIEASYYAQQQVDAMSEAMGKIGENYSVFGEIGNDSSVAIYAHLEYTRIAEKRGIFKLTCNIPSNSSSVFGIFSTTKINSLFLSNHNISFSPTGQKSFAFLADYNAKSGENIVGYAPLATWNTETIGIGRIYTTSGNYGNWALSTFSGVFHTEFTVSEV